jgi:hypothetical protein
VPRCERHRFGLNAEKFGDEVLDMGREQDQQLGLGLAGQRVRAGLHKLVLEVRAEKGQEAG